MGCPPCKQKVPGWMVTFGDMNSLLLTFFVMLIANATLDPVKIQTMAISLENRLGMGFFEGGHSLSKGKLAEMGMTIESFPANKEGSQLDKAVQAAAALFEPEVKAKKVLIREDERGLVISLIGDMFFEPGDATLLPEVKLVLDKVSKLLKSMKTEMNMDNRVEVEGFADSGQIPPGGKNYERYPSNLDLTTARANNVIKYLWASGVPETRVWKGKIYAKFKSVGYGEHQPLEPNISPEHRAYNRRVDIVIMRDDKDSK